MNKNNLKNQLIEDISDSDNDNSGFVLGTISAILLVICIGTLLMFNNKQVQRIITDKINIDSANNSNDVKKTSTLLTEKTLNVKANHPNGTIGKLTHISFSQSNTTVEIAVTNGFWNTIYLNFRGKGVILVDDLGNKYDLKPPFDNPSLEIEPNATFQGELVFQGGITSKANNLTLITNNQIGSDQPLTPRPKMEFYIPITQEDKLIKKDEEKEKKENKKEKQQSQQKD
ncbi:MAG: hypothetical protein AAF757_03825 [Cyanobacteria bacterium P01_D01_bin.116]